MRPTLVPRGRQITRICEACRHERAISTRSSRLQQQQQQQQQQQSSRLASTASSPTSTQQQRFFSNTPSHLRPPVAAPSTAEAASSTPSSESHEPAQSSSSSTTPPATTTHYDFFPETLPSGPPPRGAFAIDQRTLRREFLQLQAKAHPDLHPSHLKPRAEATSARINEAYKTLSSPLLRAQYLLDLRLGDGDGDGNGNGNTSASASTNPTTDEAAKVEDPELLMQVLETREMIEEAQDESELEGPKAENDARIRESEERLGKYFAEDDLEAAKHEAVRLRYWTNIADTLHHWEKGKPVVLEH